MLKDVDLRKYPKIYIVCGYTDLRQGVKKLVRRILYDYGLEAYDTESLFLFCGRKASVIRAVCFEGDGMVIMTKYLSEGRFMWPRNTDEAKQLSGEQFRRLMTGFTVESSIKCFTHRAASE